MKPKEAVIAVTYRCNARCEMCNIWKSSATDEMEPKHYEKLPTSLKTINITGGEPFLRKDLVDVVRSIHSRVPSSRIVFSTNGFLTETIVKTLSEVQRLHDAVGVGVSIDGLEEVHDKIRGTNGAFKKAVSTVKGLKQLGLKDLRIGMTLMQENVRDAKSVFDLSRELGVEFSVTFAHNSEIYFQKTDNMPPEFAGVFGQPLNDVLRSQLLSRSAKDWFRAYHIQGIMDPQLRREFISSCKAGSRYFFMSPSGDVYPCLVMNMRIGNLREVGNWDELFRGEVAARMNEAVNRCSEDCWMVCNTRSLIISHPFRAGSWVARNKLKAHVHKK